MLAVPSGRYPPHPAWALMAQPIIVVVAVVTIILGRLVGLRNGSDSHLDNLLSSNRRSHFWRLVYVCVFYIHKMLLPSPV